MLTNWLANTMQMVKPGFRSSWPWRICLLRTNQEEPGRLLPKSASLLCIKKEKVLKDDCHLFSKLFKSCQSRECDLKDFFRHKTRHFLLQWATAGTLQLPDTTTRSGLWISCNNFLRRTCRSICNYHRWYGTGEQSSTTDLRVVSRVWVKQSHCVYRIIIHQIQENRHRL